MTRRAWAWGVPAAALGLAALVVVYASGSPRYALYGLAAAMDRHDVVSAEAYFDLDRIADAATQVLVADYWARQPPPASPAEVLGRQVVAKIAARRLRPEVRARLRAEIRRRAEGPGPQSATLGLAPGLLAAFRAFEVSPAGPDVWVLYRAGGEPVRFRMSRQADRSWKIVELDPEWVRRRAQEERLRVR